MPGGYRQAQRSTTLAQQLGRVNTVTRYADLGFYRLLVLLPEHERNRFVTEILGPLAGDDAEHADLRRTLRVVGENRGNIRAAADRLFIHPNTLRQRIGKLNHLLGPFLDDADAYLNVYIALALHRLRGARVTTGPSRDDDEVADVRTSTRRPIGCPCVHTQPLRACPRLGLGPPRDPAPRTRLECPMSLVP